MALKLNELIVTNAINGGVTGNAATATILQTARNIGGVSFNGSADINLPGVNTAGNQNTSGNAATATALTSMNISQFTNNSGYLTSVTNISGNAGTATILQTARTIGGVSFNGSANINLPGVNTAGNQNTSGNAATATSASFATTAATATNVSIANGSIVLAKIENITAYTILGNSNASAAATPAALSVATVATMLSGQTMNIAGSSTSCSGNAATATTATNAIVNSGNTSANWYPIVWHSGNTLYSTAGVTLYAGGSYIQTAYFNSSDDVSTGNISHIVAKFGDNYHRSATAAKVAAFITGQTMNINGSSTSCSGNATTATNVAASGITGQTGMWTSTARPGPYRLYRNDDNSAYNVQLTWQAHRTNYWSLRGYLNDTFHAECFVVYSGYADTAGALTTTSNYQVANLGISVAPSNRLHVNGDGTNPAIRVDNGAVVLAASAASNSKTFYGWLPISIAGTTKWIQMYN
jgi:hypothetical protein